MNGITVGEILWRRSSYIECKALDVSKLTGIASVLCERTPVILGLLFHAVNENSDLAEHDIKDSRKLVVVYIVDFPVRRLARVVRFILFFLFLFFCFQLCEFGCGLQSLLLHLALTIIFVVTLFVAVVDYS